jgi:glyoxylase-like metal-dependent hydrolase (beta-lactamase superfamily II)
MARRQEQEAARSEVTEVAKDILRIELPIRMPGLGHVNCFVICDADGAAVMDPGLPGPGTWRVLQERLARAGLRTRDVHTVIITHSHPDHFGCANRFAKEAGARIVAHRRFHFGALSAASPEVSVDDIAAHHRHAHGAPQQSAVGAGIPADLQEAIDERHHILTRAAARGRTPWGSERRSAIPFFTRLFWHAAHWIGRSFVPRITHPVEHGDVLELAGREWFVVHTPGHTPDHFCLHDPATGVLLAGDHVLPTITPHISGLGSSPDPLASFFYSLDRVAEIEDVERVLPAHGHPFSDLPARIQAIKRHHEQRLERVKAISREIGPATVTDFSHRLFQPRSWGIMAESETFAHLEHLRIARQAERREAADGQMIYVVG